MGLDNFNAITDVPGILVGHAQDEQALTGCTVILCMDGATGGVDQRGGAAPPAGDLLHGAGGHRRRRVAQARIAAHARAGRLASLTWAQAGDRLRALGDVEVIYRPDGAAEVHNHGAAAQALFETVHIGDQGVPYRRILGNDVEPQSLVVHFDIDPECAELLGVKAQNHPSVIGAQLRLAELFLNLRHYLLMAGCPYRLSGSREWRRLDFHANGTSDQRVRRLTSCCCIRRHVDRYGIDRVETFMDACLTLDNLIDIHASGIHRRPAERADLTPQVAERDGVAVDGRDGHHQPRGVTRDLCAGHGIPHR